jgi:hypothetical protein
MTHHTYHFLCYWILLFWSVQCPTSVSLIYRCIWSMIHVFPGEKSVTYAFIKRWATDRKLSQCPPSSHNGNYSGWSNHFGITWSIFFISLSIFLDWFPGVHSKESTFCFDFMAVYSIWSLEGDTSSEKHPGCLVHSMSMVCTKGFQSLFPIWGLAILFYTAVSIPHTQ